jgi:hypothetical protein
MTMADTRIEEKYEDVLQNIESGVMSVYHAHPALTDWDVEVAYEALIQFYQAEVRQKPVSLRQLDGLQAATVSAAQAMCEWRLGRETMFDKHDQPIGFSMEPIAVADLVACLKRLRKSVQFWTKAGGHQGYLNYIREFVR